MSPLPWADDVRSLTLPPLPSPTHEMKQAMVSFIDEFMLSNHHYKPSLTVNPSIQKFYALCLSKLLDDEQVLTSYKDRLDTLVSPDSDLLQQLDESGVTQHLKELFPLKIVEQKSGKRKREIWAQKVAKAADIDALIQENDTAKKKPRVVLTVRTTDPVEDFRKMLAETSEDLTDAAVEQMAKVIETLIFEGGLPYYSKAIKAIKEFRSTAVSECYTPSYNKFITSLISRCKETDVTRILEKIDEDKLGVITIDEDPKYGAHITPTETHDSKPPDKMEDEDDILNLLD